MLSIFIAGCRSVIPSRELLSSSEPDISRIVLKKGDSVVVFNRNFGWYDKRAGIIEGVTIDTQHVEYRLSEIIKVETVRNYAVIPAIVACGMVLGAALYLVAKLLTL